MQLKNGEILDQQAIEYWREAACKNCMYRHSVNHLINKKIRSLLFCMLDNSEIKEDYWCPAWNIGNLICHLPPFLRMLLETSCDIKLAEHESTLRKL